MELVSPLLLLSIGTSLLKILCLTIVAVMHSVHCNICKNMFSLFYDSQGCLCPNLCSILSVSGLEYHCSPCGVCLQVKVILGCLSSLSLLFNMDL